MRKTIQQVLKKLWFIMSHFFLGIFFYVKEAIEYGRVVTLYYRYPRFVYAELLLRLSYLGARPDSICTQHITHHSAAEVQDVYGETPLTTFATICRAAHVKAGDTLYELGCGRGRLVLWAGMVLQVNAVGIDINPTFIKRAQRIKRWTNSNNINFRCANIVNCDLSQADVVYLYGSAFEQRAIPNLLAMLSTAQPGTTIITTTWSLIELSDCGDFVLNQQLMGEYLWGKTSVYIHTKLH